jgi:hypothetical protein
MILQTYSRAAGSLLLILITAPAATRTDSAVEQLQRLQAELQKSQTSNDWYSDLASANKLKELLNNAPDSLLEVAHADVRIGELNAAVHELEQFARMGQSTDLLAMSSDFATLVKKPTFAKIEDKMKANRSPVSLGSKAFLLGDPGLLAEDIDYDPANMRFFITSVREKKIISTGISGVSADFAKAPDDWPVLAVKVDPRHGVVWATEVAMRGFNLSRQSDWGRSALVCYNLKNGRLLRRIEGPRQSALGDMVLTANGDVIVSDGDGGGVYRALAKGTVMERLDGGEFISPQTPAMHPDGQHIFIPDYARGIGVLDIATKQVRWLSMAGRFALNGIDGLYFHRRYLIAVQNGTSPPRVVVFTLDATLTRIESETIVERSTDTLGDPTHGVLIHNDFYYIANSGWDSIDDHGNVKPGREASVPRVMRVHL